MQKEIAAFFCVSPVAICKRLKRLLPQPAQVLDKYNLTNQQKQFVIEKAKGKTNTQAVMASYEVTSMQSAKVIGSQLMHKPKIPMAINDLGEQLKIYMPQNYRVRKLRSHADNPDPVVSLKALDLSWKLDGSYVSEKQITEQYSYIKIDLTPDKSFWNGDSDRCAICRDDRRCFDFCKVCKEADKGGYYPHEKLRRACDRV